MTAHPFFDMPGDRGASAPIGFPGAPAGETRVRSGVASVPQSAQVTTIAIPASPDNSTAYTVTVDGVTATYTTDASATQGELGAGLVAALNVNPGIRSRMGSAYSGGTLTMTAAWPGQTFTVTAAGGSGGGAIGTPSTTAPNTAAIVYMGRVVCSQANATDEPFPALFMPTTARFSAQVTTFTYASVASGDIISTTVEMNGQSTTVVTAYNSSHAQTLTDHTADLEVRLNALFGAGVGCVAANASNDITITSDVAGGEFYASSTIGGTGGGTVTKANTTGPSVSTSLRRSLLGISCWRSDVPDQTIAGNDPAYGANDPVPYHQDGLVYMARDTTETWDRNSETWVSVSTTATLSGRIYDTSSSTRVWLPNAALRVIRQEPSTQSHGLGVVELGIGA